MGSTAKEQNTGPAREALYGELRADILTRRIRDGAKLSEAYICKRYQVSRTPAREALLQLESEGLVQMIPNRGAFVSALSDRDISDIFEMRRLLEAQATDWAIRRMSSDDIEILYETLDLMELYTLRGDAAMIAEFEERFHSIIYEGSGDRLLRNTLLTYQAYLRHTLPVSERSLNQLEDILKEHRAIYQAIEARDVTAGRKAAEEHVRRSKARLMSDY